jgi:hypothetical protein
MIKAKGENLMQQQLDNSNTAGATDKRKSVREKEEI